MNENFNFATASLKQIAQNMASRNFVANQRQIQDAIANLAKHIEELQNSEPMRNYLK